MAITRNTLALKYAGFISDAPTMPNYLITLNGFMLSEINYQATASPSLRDNEFSPRNRGINSIATMKIAMPRPVNRIP